MNHLKNIAFQLENLQNLKMIYFYQNQNLNFKELTYKFKIHIKNIKIIVEWKTFIKV